MPENYIDVIEQLRQDSEYLLRIVGGDDRSRQTGMIDRLDDIQASLNILSEQMKRVWISISLSFGLLLMVIMQLIWHGMNL
jgi:hypothetical protein